MGKKVKWIENKDGNILVFVHGFLTDFLVDYAKERNGYKKEADCAYCGLYAQYEDGSISLI